MAVTDEDIPTLGELLRLTPTTFIISMLIMLGAWGAWKLYTYGFKAGFESREDHIGTLKDWIESLKERK